MRLSQLLEEKRKAKKRQAMAKTATTVGITAVVGASVGALGGVLLAPKSGKETREDIKASAVDANEKLKVKAVEAKTKLNEGIQVGKENLNEANSKIREYLKNKRSGEKVVELETQDVKEIAVSQEAKEDIQA